MAEEWMDLEYISLHGYVRNKLSDTKVHAEYQLRADRSTWPVMQNRTKELGVGRAGVLVGLDFSWHVEELKQGSDPRIGAIVWVRRETFKAERETADLWQSKWKENQTVHSRTYPGQGCWSPGRHSSCKLEFRDCGAIQGWVLLLTAEMDWRDVRKEIMVGNVCGGKLHSHGSKVVLVSHGSGCSHHHSLSPPSIASWTGKRLAYQTPDTLN